MRDIVITLADELRFLGVQCAAHARGSHRDQDREFISTLLANLFEIAPNFSVLMAALVLPAANLPDANLPALIARVSRDLDQVAQELDRDAQGRAA